MDRASNVYENCAALYPLPTCSFRSLVEEGALAPQFSKNSGHLVKVVFSVTETLFQFDAEQNQCDLCSLGVPVRAIRRGGYTRIVDVLFGKVSTHPRSPSERLRPAICTDTACS